MSDALYHNAQHTALVALVAQDVLRGLRLERPVSPDDWLHFMLAALAHDLGYVRGICPGDVDDRQVIDAAGTTVLVPRGASDAFLTPYHVSRSQIVVRWHFASHQIIDAERIARAIELTRFPVPDDDDHAATGIEAGLVRAADLIGQLGDPLYPHKLNALFYEFAERLVFGFVPRACAGSIRLIAVLRRRIGWRLRMDHLHSVRPRILDHLA